MVLLWKSIVYSVFCCFSSEVNSFWNMQMALHPTSIHSRSRAGGRKNSWVVDSEISVQVFNFRRNQFYIPDISFLKAIGNGKQYSSSSFNGSPPIFQPVKTINLAIFFWKEITPRQTFHFNIIEIIERHAEFVSKNQHSMVRIRDGLKRIKMQKKKKSKFEKKKNVNIVLGRLLLFFQLKRVSSIRVDLFRFLFCVENKKKKMVKNENIFTISLTNFGFFFKRIEEENSRSGLWPSQDECISNWECFPWSSFVKFACSFEEIYGFLLIENCSESWLERTGLIAESLLFTQFGAIFFHEFISES